MHGWMTRTRWSSMTLGSVMGFSQGCFVMVGAAGLSEYVSKVDAK